MSRYLRFWAVIAIISAVCVKSYAAEEIFDQANRAYAEKDYQQAAELYERGVEQYPLSAEIHYNLGNAYFRSGHKGLALWAYTKAHQLAPDDEDIFYNLNYAKTQVEVTQVKDDRTLQDRVIHAVVHAPGKTGWLAIGVVFSFIFSFLMITAVRNRSLNKKSLPGFTVLLLLSILCAVLSVYAGKEMHSVSGIIINDGVKVRYKPSYDGAVSFEVREGSEIPVIREYNDWFQIRVSEKLSGWVSASDFRIL